MKFYQFYREEDNFDDILQDITLKKKIYTKIRWSQHLLIGINDSDESVFSYVEIKYGDSLRNSLTKDYSPIPNVDYLPIRKKVIPYSEE